MISGGDELGRTQGGNNNAYCQDNEISWYQWDLDEDDQNFLKFVQKLVKIRKSQLSIQRKEFFKGEVDEDGVLKKDVAWFSPTGKAMQDADWRNSENKCLGVLWEGRAVHEVDLAHGHEEEGKSLFLIANASFTAVPFKLPRYNYLSKWQVLVDTSKPDRPVEDWTDAEVAPRSVVLLERV